MSAVPSTLELPSSVELGQGQGGLAIARVFAPTGTAEVYLRGAHVSAWTPAGGTPVIWMSEQSEYATGVPLRGGVPICFPWFAAHPTDATAPSHGFARLADWQLVEAHEAGDDVALVFVLTDTDASRASAWPHRFEARYTVTVGARLTLALEVTNRDTETVSFEEALHTYLAVADICQTEVAGLEGAPFTDRLSGPRPAESTPVRFDAETDRIYLNTPATTTVTDASTGRVITVAKQGSASTVVWNPWIDKAAAMADFGDTEYTGMVCVETCNIRDNTITLAPGESHEISASYSVA
ncbi:D-hexose-6-phosphate mutarotase [Cryobacterium sp. PAMC25264]|uniref:D-hexose-6-phosphate mutarotase n=1 Tax=Cryobacterium sp. PAMC25264 TaxID=2861288 RepID=UPI001C629CBC|nr:D-hexose-6-phosphate mutarotase [Cryobacterium sp. PAMC25264]QYF73242.1 D-hexose-6-phosphate mutarotase [Cryobacterium sp. PAMC25264]